MTTRIGMWSGPRNISTAMMRSWENRSDTSVVDEPFYAYYLSQTQSPHPMFDEIIQAQDTDYSKVAQYLSKGECESHIQYQKLMTHHMPNGCDLNWTHALTHCFLIRDPAYIVNSYTQSRGVCSADDIGIKRQYELYQAISKITQQPIPIIDADAILNEPEHILPAMCKLLDLPFESSMLRWPAGKRDSDGVWASHWYTSVEASTHFSKPTHKSLSLSHEQMAVVEEVLPYYLKLKENVIY